MSLSGQNWEIKFLSQGALIQSFYLDNSNVVLGFTDAQSYKSHSSAYFGETIGRTTNRIKGGLIENLNDKTYSLPKNDGQNSLHGGEIGWGKKEFVGPQVVKRHDREALLYTYISPHGEEGYPGTVECRVWYSAKQISDRIVLDMEVEIELIGSECEETVVYASNHSYFNLNPDQPNISGTMVKLSTTRCLEQRDGIPTGRTIQHPLLPDAATTLVLGDSEPSFDNCFVMSTSDQFTLDTRDLPLRSLAVCSHPSSGIHLEVCSTEPAFQLYTGDAIDIRGRSHHDGSKTSSFCARAGFAIEAGRYVDCQRKEWRNQCLLRKGQRWGSRTQYQLWKENVAGALGGV